MGEAERTLQAIEGAGGTAIMMQADVRSEVAVRHLFAETKRRFGRVDIVVNNAAVSQRVPIEHFNEEQYRQVR
jgi:3-oxoacyl-[acyl-carrier protein] reductase